MKRFSFSRQNKLTTQEFSRLFRQGSRFKTPCFILIYQSAALSKLGIAIPKKHLAKSTQRNATKRLIREQFRLQRNIGHFSITLCSRPQIKMSDRQQVKRELQACWDHLDTMND